LSRTFFQNLFSCRFLLGYGKLAGVLLNAFLVFFTLTVLPFPASAWNIPGHMLSAAIAYQVLRQESPGTIEKVIAVLEKHPWYENQWRARLQDVPAGVTASCCSCRRPGGPTTFVSETSNSTVDRGITSIRP
jgi:hypothetical protein